jgi:hypothetical protein
MATAETPARRRKRQKLEDVNILSHACKRVQIHSLRVCVQSSNHARARAHLMSCDEGGKRCELSCASSSWGSGFRIPMIENSHRVGGREGFCASCPNGGRKLPTARNSAFALGRHPSPAPHQSSWSTSPRRRPCKPRPLQEESGPAQDLRYRLGQDLGYRLGQTPRMGLCLALFRPRSIVTLTPSSF